MVLGLPPALAAEPGTAPVPAVVRALAGCWHGTGTVMGKPVDIGLSAHPMVLDALFALDADSTATGDARDRYAAHLLVGGRDTTTRTAPQALTGVWADSFGGGYITLGTGQTVPGGFDLTYRNGGVVFANHWRLDADRLHWDIQSRDGTAPPAAFARYTMTRAPCAHTTAR
ncbi:hypothetical protein AA103196_0439 [Ameyamaea chiangmaiensis NBRC 103196]|nr:hypothetical protein AA103196_0439 [Ameyamaea chiangmaiensis NBRC 103196]